MMASSDGSLDDKEGPALGTLEGREKKHQEDAKAPEPGVQGMEEEVRLGTSEGSS